MSKANAPASQNDNDPKTAGATRLAVRALDRLAEVSPEAWNALIPGGPGAVFLRHEWLSALEQAGCVGDDTGWVPQHVVVYREDAPETLLAALPLYLKYHSYGEYVFDWAWADAWQRAGQRYYPKLLSAVPFTPVAGPRFLGDPALAPVIRTSLEHLVHEQKLSSAHILLESAPGCFPAEGWMARKGVQFHWQNAAFRHFEDFLNSLSQPKRKKIRAERRKAAEAGVECRWIEGKDISSADWQHFMRCYTATYHAHHSEPYLNLAFFEHAHQAMPEAFVLIVARVDGQDVAASLLICDGDRLYGRHWGAIAHVPFMHFEVAYYQSIEYAIDRGYQCIEGGAQGEHKMARGFLPVETGSWHYLRDQNFADAVERFLSREGHAMDGYLDELNERNPFREAPVSPAPKA